MEYFLITNDGEFTLCTQAGVEVISAKMEDAGIYEDPDPMYQDKLERYIEEKTGIPADAWDWMMKANQISISYQVIDNYMWCVERYLLKRYGSTQARIDIDPLRWYVSTSRAPVQFLRLMIQKKPYLVARILHKKGESYNEIIGNIKKYIGFEEV